MLAAILSNALPICNRLVHPSPHRIPDRMDRMDRMDRVDRMRNLAPLGACGMPIPQS